MSIVVDSHQHFWDRTISRFDHSWQEAEGLEKICRNFMPDDLRPEIVAAGVDKTVFVQTQHNLDENRWALELADKNEFICGVVGWVDLTSTQSESQIREFCQIPAFIGVRHVVQDEPDDDFIVREDVLNGLRQLESNEIPFDLLFYPKHLKHCATVAQKLPNMKLVIDHMSKPDIKLGRTKRWQNELQSAAACPNVWCKISGLVTEANWNHWSIDDFRPYFDTALELFGPNRLMFGSDWPVCNLAADYSQVFHLASELIGQLSSSEQEQIFGLTAIDFYQLNVT